MTRTQVPIYNDNYQNQSDNSSNETTKLALEIANLKRQNISQKMIIDNMSKEMEIVRHFSDIERLVYEQRITELEKQLQEKNTTFKV